MPPKAKSAPRANAAATAKAAPRPKAAAGPSSPPRAANANSPKLQPPKKRKCTDAENAWCQAFEGFPITRIEDDGSNVPEPTAITDVQRGIWRKVYIKARDIVYQDDYAGGADDAIEEAGQKVCSSAGNGKLADREAVFALVWVHLWWFRDGIMDF